MKLEYDLWQKAAKFAIKNYGLCERLRETDSDSERGVLLKNCCNICDKHETCLIHHCASSFVVGSTWMMHRVKPIVLGKVMEDIIESDSPYMNGPAFFDEKI